MTDQELAERAVAAVKADDEDARNVRAGPIVHDFLGGDLVFVFFDYEGEDDGSNEYYVHLRADRSRIYYYSTDLARAVVQHKPDHYQILRAGAPLLLALLITGTICYLAIARTPSDIPEILGAALTAILGFYFGSYVTKK
jgi:hypothetical protein